MPKVFNAPKTTRKTPYPDPKRKSKPNSSDRKPGAEAKEYPSINDLKRRIRDSKRLLNKPDLPADKRIIQERALAGYEKELADEERRRERSRMIKKYHFVRFLDRKTATKEVTKLTKKHAELSADETLDDQTKQRKLAKLDAHLHTAKVNLNYTIYYPLTEKYVSIYAEKKKGGGSRGHIDGTEDSDDETQTRNQAKNASGRRPSASSSTNASTTPGSGSQAMWLAVQKCMEEGTLDLLREGKLNLGDKETGSKKEKSNPETTKKNAGDKGKKAARKDKSAKSSTSNTNIDKIQRKGRSGPSVPTPAPVESGDESDGGFFEM
ncbi:Efg1 domain-containing protein [Aspergillus undulatus]|uniref:Efg1 domain-containing protein n=1 Tax=Aspergillus undulatus TaxID=1810928 RepID=UPI003CCD3342